MVGNFPQAFSHLAAGSAPPTLSRTPTRRSLGAATTEENGDPDDRHLATSPTTWRCWTHETELLPRTATAGSLDDETIREASRLCAGWTRAHVLSAPRPQRRTRWGGSVGRANTGAPVAMYAVAAGTRARTSRLGLDPQRHGDPHRPQRVGLGRASPRAQQAGRPAGALPRSRCAAGRTVRGRPAADAEAARRSPSSTTSTCRRRLHVRRNADPGFGRAGRSATPSERMSDRGAGARRCRCVGDDGETWSIGAGARDVTGTNAGSCSGSPAAMSARGIQPGSALPELPAWG